ncbi:MAG: hypothetical protein D8M58_03150 [Calditrichaeota bacterium]|nr:MAG: hypothetical protein DWQ03_03930 [Calditrichota bacterium]MBL1204363.1 hypothetical protein [Calditrichota bacterium]NOG44192.1 hypothetical protein [Calditrichota bacterium]
MSTELVEEKKTRAGLSQDMENENGKVAESQKETIIDHSTQSSPEFALTDTIFNNVTSFKDKPTITQKLSAQNYLAIDIDSDNIRYIIGSYSGKAIFVKDTGVSLIPDSEKDRDKALKITLDNIKTNVYKAGYKVHVGFFSPDVTIRKFQFPKMRNLSEFKNAVFFKLQSDLTGFNDKSVWRYKIINEFQDGNTRKVNVVVLVVPGSIVDKYMDMLESSGLSPETITPRSVSSANAFSKMVGSDNQDMLVDISYDTTHICYLNNGNLEFTRNLATGASNLEIAIHEKQGNILKQDIIQPVEDAGIGKNGALKPELIRKALQQRLRTLQAHQNPVLQLFKNELQHSIDHFNNLDKNQDVKRIFLTGYGLQKESLLSFLKNNMKVPVFVLAPKLSDAEENLLKHGQFFSTLGTVINTKDSFNLVSKEFRAQGVFKRLNYLVSALIAFSLLGSVYLTNLSYTQIDNLKNEVEKVENKYNTLNPVEVEYQKLNSEIKNIKSTQNSLKKLVTKTGPVIEALKLISNETPEQIILSAISVRHSSSITIGGKKNRKARKNSNKKKPVLKAGYSINLSGVVNGDYLMSDVILINYLDHLKNLGYFKSIEITDKNKKNKKQSMQFEIKAVL